MRAFSSSWSKLLLLAVALPVVATACGSDEGSAAPVGSGAGSSGAAGATGLAGAAGKSGAGTTGGTSAGGAAGKAGGAGASAGTAGASGGGGGCKVAADCPTIETQPVGCAEALCTAGVCGYRAVDADADGHRTKTCQSTATPKITIELGDDCDDAQASTFPGAWDGPAVDGKPDHCKDGVDQDCSGSDGDGKGSKGESCTCTPGDVQTCDQTDDGKPITFPGGKPQGACSLGSRTCVVDAITKSAVFGPCTGATVPTKEVCNGGVDDDCDGQADMLDADPPLNTATWSYDGDGDGYVLGSAARTEWCGDERPTKCPAGMTDCDPLKWKLGNLPGGDCDDQNENARPDAIEKCNAAPGAPPVDLDCNGITNAPGAGDCACRDGDVVACAPGDKNYPATATAPSDKYPLPAVPDFQSGGLVGECRWGQKECVKGQWSGCHDGVGAKAAENCSLADKKDYDCNGIPNRNADNSTSADCSCTGSDTQPCGDCGKGTATCSGGVFGACLGDDAKVSYCSDADGDGVCGGGCQLECPAADHAKRRLASTCFGSSSVVDCNDTTPTVGQNVKEACSALDENCDGNGYEGFDFGAACNNGLKGSCARTGTKVCAGTSATTCSAGPVAASNDYIVKPSSGSWDVNCDGIEEHRPPYTFGATFAPSAATLGEFGLTACTDYALTSATSAAIYKACQQAFPGFPTGTTNRNKVLLCANTVSASTPVQAEATAIYTDGLNRKLTTACGADYVQLICNPNTKQAGAQRFQQSCR